MLGAAIGHSWEYLYLGHGQMLEVRAAASFPPLYFLLPFLLLLLALPPELCGKHFLALH